MLYAWVDAKEASRIARIISESPVEFFLDEAKGVLVISRQNTAEAARVPLYPMSNMAERQGVEQSP